jgi:hypothetical protein
MLLFENDKDTEFYVPHHIVIKESNDTTKLRVFFNRSD